MTEASNYGSPQKALQFIQQVDEECRRWGGKHLLTREEYLDIVNRIYRDIYGKDDNQPASV